MQLVIVGAQTLAYYTDDIVVPRDSLPAGAQIVPYAGPLKALGRLGTAPAQGEVDLRPYRAPVSVDLVAYAALRRFYAEIGGVVLGGQRFPTDREVSQAKITAAYVKALSDPAYAINNFKVGPAAFVTLDNATIIALGDAVEAHVQACFSAEAKACAGIASGAIADLDGVDALFAAFA